MTGAVRPPAARGRCGETAASGSLFPSFCLGSSTSCFRWPLSDGCSRYICCCPLRLYRVRRAEGSAAFSFVRISCASSRRALLSRGWQHGPGVTVREAGGFLEWGKRRELRRPRGHAWLGAAHVRPALPAATGGAGRLRLGERLCLGRPRALGSPAPPRRVRVPPTEHPFRTSVIGHHVPPFPRSLPRALSQW